MFFLHIWGAIKYTCKQFSSPFFWNIWIRSFVAGLISASGNNISDKDVYPWTSFPFWTELQYYYFTVSGATVPALQNLGLCGQAASLTFYDETSRRWYLHKILSASQVPTSCGDLVRRVESDLSNASFSFSTHGSLPLSAEPPERVTPASPGPRARQELPAVETELGGHKGVSRPGMEPRRSSHFL